jgi:hypothetical protein
MKLSLPLTPAMEISYVVMDAKGRRWIQKGLRGGGVRTYKDADKIDYAQVFREEADLIGGSCGRRFSDWKNDLNPRS